MRNITMLQFRKNSESVVRMLRRGQRLTLTYRGKALARLEPIRPRTRDPSGDPLFSVHERAKSSPLGPLDHRQIDRIVYGKR